MQEPLPFTTGATVEATSPPMPATGPAPPAPAGLAPPAPAGLAPAARRASSGTETIVVFGLIAALLAFILWYSFGNPPAGLRDAMAIPPVWQALMPDLVIMLFAVLAPIVGLGNSTGRDMRNFTLFGLGGALALTIFSLMGGVIDLGFWRFDALASNFDYIKHSQDALAAGDPVANVLGVTYASQIFKVLFLGVGFLAVLGVGRPLKGKVEEDWGEFYSLILFATLGMMVVASARDLIVLWLGIEMASMSSYVLAGFRRDHIGAEASLKYFTIGAISSGLALFAISLLYGMAGTTDIRALATVMVAHGPFDAAMLIPIVLLLAGLGFKISSVPFHAWAPDVYVGAPVPVAGMLAAASKAMGFAALFTVFLVGMPDAKANWELVVAVIAVVSMFVGNLIALQQTNIRRMLAYSSIAQAGYLLIALAAAGSVGGAHAQGTDAMLTASWSLGGGVFHLIVNAAMKLGAFLIVGALLLAGLPDQLQDWRGLGRRNPLIAFAMTVFLLSMAGLPPLGGFASKFVLFGGAVDSAFTHGYGWLAALAVIAVINSAISLWVYIRVMRTMYVDEGEPGRLPIANGTGVAIGICAVLVILMGVWPQPFLDASFKAAQSLLGFT